MFLFLFATFLARTEFLLVNLFYQKCVKYQEVSVEKDTG